jgi:hypothetical protein
MGISEPDFRMRDVELVLRFFAYLNFAGQYDGNLKRFLDDTARRLNERLKSDAATIKAQGKALNDALNATFEIFGPSGNLRKWNGVSYERRINRAVFDIMTYFFADQKIRDRAVTKKAEVEDSFKNLCTHNNDFLSSLEATTKSREANHIRFSVWSKALSEITKLKIQSPL